eukprot:5905888-Prymnesium_polylepis.1
MRRLVLARWAHQTPSTVRRRTSLMHIEPLTHHCTADGQRTLPTILAGHGCAILHAQVPLDGKRCAAPSQWAAAATEA